MHRPEKPAELENELHSWHNAFITITHLNDIRKHIWSQDQETTVYAQLLYKLTSETQTFSCHGTAVLIRRMECTGCVLTTSWGPIFAYIFCPEYYEEIIRWAEWVERD